MKLLVRIAVLALAAVGARSLYEKYAPKVDDARRRGNRLIDQSLRPAVHDAATTIGDAANQAASTLADASRDVAETVRDPSHVPGTGTGEVESIGPFGDPQPPEDTHEQHLLSPMAAHELGVETPS